MRSRNQEYSTRKAGGFTLIELVAVLAVISVMLALLLPAILLGVARARRAQCANNMRQMTIALNNYHDVYSTLPPAWICDRRDQDEPQWGWNVLLLPLIEQQALHDGLQPGPTTIQNIFTSETTPFASATTSGQMLASELYTTQCPESGEAPHPTRRFDWGIGVPEGWQAPRSNYVANIGFFCRTADYENHGPMYGNSGLPMQAIIDGTSSTILFGERDSLGGAGTWVGGVVSVPMNSPTVEGYRDRGFSSQHPGGSQFGFCDGSVRFISATIDFNNGSGDRFDSTSDTLLTKAEKAELGVYQRLGVRDDERPISNLP